MKNKFYAWSTCLALGLVVEISPASAENVKVALIRTPDEGIQPQTAMDVKGTVHLIYFKKGQTDGVPVWSLPTAFTQADGNFVIFY